MKRRRSFNITERNILWLAADGKCQMCGQPLGDDWEPDHVLPFSEGGETNIANGQALCKRCNRKKGNKLMIELREFQQRFVNQAIEKAKSGTKELVCNVFAGSGKTLASQVAADQLMELGYIDQVVVFVPRLNLAKQYELDWEEMRGKLPWKPTMQALRKSDNRLPLIYENASGYITTYSSLCSKPELHIEQIAKKRTLLILDEAHQLGIDEHGIDPTKSAHYTQLAGDKAELIFVMSGTPYRADGKALLFAQYSDKDSAGKAILQPDLEATYRDGVREGYLRRFEARMINGGYMWNDLDGSEEKTLRGGDASVYRALQLEEIWKQLVNNFVEVLLEQKQLVDDRMCGLIATIDQKQAEEVYEYLQRSYPNLGILKAISDDGKNAQDALSNFKQGKHDILVTVSMAYIGYDHKPINTILLLTHFRSKSYLTQLVARGLRMWGDVDEAKQQCHILAPDDPLMQDFVEHMRSESEAGYQERKEKQQKEASTEVETGGMMTLGYASDGFLSDMRAMGLDPMGDLTPEEFEYADSLRRAKGLPYPVTDLIGFMRAFQTSASQVNAVTVRPTKTLEEQIADAKSTLKDQVNRLWHKTGTEQSMIYGRLKIVYNGTSVPSVRSVEEVRARSKTVLRWIQQGFIDYDQ